MKSSLCLVALMCVSLMVPQSRSASASEEPACARSCIGIPGIREIHITITDEGETCTLDPQYRQCIYTKCQVSQLPEGTVQNLKRQGCDLTGGSSKNTPSLALLSAVLAAVVCFMLR